MADTKHPAEALADELARMRAQLDPVDDWREPLDLAGAALRRIPALEAERDALKETLHDELAENLALRELGGAGPDEGMALFLRRVIAERDRLLADAARLDWLAEPSNFIGNVQLPAHCVAANLHSMRAAIDMAMRESETKEPK